MGRENKTVGLSSIHTCHPPLTCPLLVASCVSVAWPSGGEQARLVPVHRAVGQVGSQP